VWKVLLKLETLSRMLVLTGRKGLYELFKDWAAKQLTDPQSKDKAEEGKVPVEFKKAKDISFMKNESGGLILLPMTGYDKAETCPCLCWSHV
jgi:hypothetical protein